jgi:hypothetical protein
VLIGGKEAIIKTVKWPKRFEMANNSIQRNIMVYASEEAYLYAHTQQAPGFPYRAKDFSADRNLIWPDGADVKVQMNADPGDAIGFKQWQKLGMDTKSVIADPCFVDSGNGDWRLREGSPAGRIGFEAIPVDEIGLYADPPYRDLD